MQSDNLTRDAIKILGIYFSYNMNLMNQKITVKLLPIFMAFQNYGGRGIFLLKIKS